MGMPEEEAGRGCKQHSTAWTLTDPRSKSVAKTREGGEEGDIMGWRGRRRDRTRQGEKGCTRREGREEEVRMRTSGREEGGL